MLRMATSLSLLTVLISPRVAEAKPKTGVVGTGTVPALEETLIAAGWTMTPERSASYTVGDIYSGTTNTPVAFKDDCFDAEPRENAYTSLEVVQAMRAGSRVPLGVARFKAEGMEYKQLKFAEPYMTELADMHLRPNENCQQFLAGRTDLADLFVIKAVLSAEVKEQLCRSLDGSAGALGFGASAGVQQECVQASEGHVAVAYKTQAAATLLRGVVVRPTVATAPSAQTPIASPSQASSSVDFGAGVGGLGVAARLREQGCVDTVREKGAEARELRISTAEREVQNKARNAWSKQAGELESCVKLPREQRNDCIAAVEEWLRVAKAMVVDLPAGVEMVSTECGQRQRAYAASQRIVAAHDVTEAEALLARLTTAIAHDRDKDGVEDHLDLCPDHPEDRDGYNDDDGCPDLDPEPPVPKTPSTKRVFLESGHIRITERIFFDEGLTTIQASSLSIVDEIATILMTEPDLRIRVEAHTHSMGAGDANLRLSDGRAKSVVAALSERGVFNYRLEGVGYGEARPVDTNRTREGRENNERLEFIIR